MDKRVERTREQILRTFHELVLSKPYESITVQEIIATAGIARSTFYGHFPDKRTLLITSMGQLLEILADCALDSARDDAVEELVEHFWENRHLGRVILSSAPQRSIAAALADLLFERGFGTGMECTAQSYAYLGTVQRWLAGELAATKKEMVAFLVAE